MQSSSESTSRAATCAATPSYALVEYDGEEIDRDVVSHRKLRRLIDDEAGDRRDG